MKVTTVSDLHGSFPDLPGGDLLIIAGDLIARNSVDEYFWFRDWLQLQDYEKKILIAGNHDTRVENGGVYFSNRWLGATYLCDSGTEYKGYKIWGTPWTPWFEGVNPLCSAFMIKSEFVLKDKFDLIPEDIHILVTHGPCFGRLDKTLYGDNAGSIALRYRVDHLRGKQLKLHIHGHIHEAYGMHEEGGLKTLNVARMNRQYKPVNDVVNFEI